MKRIIYMGLPVFIISGCVKEKGDGDCRLIRTTSYSGSGVEATTTSIEYNGDSKISLIRIQNSFSTSTTSYSYFADSIVALSGSVRTTYFLNASGMADSSRVFNSGYNPDKL